MTYSIEVRYGTYSGKLVYAKGLAHLDAEAMQRTAISFGYSDATIVPEEKAK